MLDAAYAVPEPAYVRAMRPDEEHARLRAKPLLQLPE